MEQLQFDNRKKISFPRFNHYNYPIRYIIEEGVGARYVYLPPATKETASIGSKYSPDYACAPFKHTLGDLLESLDAGADVVIEVGGLCRLDYYGELQREIIRELGYRCEFVNLAEYMAGSKKGWLKLLKIINPKYKLPKVVTGLTEGVKMAEYMDEIEALYYQNMGQEAVPGSYKKVYRQFLSDMKLAETKEEIRAGYQKAKQQMEEIPLKPRENLIRIGVVGEYFTAQDEHCNQMLEEKLCNLGASVYRFLNFTNCHLRGKEENLRPKIAEYVQYNMGANDTWTIYAALDYAKRGFDGVVHVKSFGCTPEMDCMPVLQNISKDYHMPVLYLSYDLQESDTGLDTRLEAFYDMLERKQKVLR